MKQPPTLASRQYSAALHTAASRAVVGHEKPTDKQLPPKTWLVSGQ